MVDVIANSVNTDIFVKPRASEEEAPTINLNMVLDYEGCHEGEASASTCSSQQSSGDRITLQ